MNQTPPGAPRILIASSLTKIHPGMGRSPGIVDLPVIRDPLGYPFIPGSQVKGAIKSLLARKYACLDDSNGKVKCNNGREECKKLCCLLGPDEAEQVTSSLQISDLYPLFIPAPSAEKGVVYVTTPTLLSRGLIALKIGGITLNGELLENNPEFKTAESLASFQEVYPNGVHIGMNKILAQYNESLKNFVQDLEEYYEELNPLYQKLPPKDRIIMVKEEEALTIIESLLHRVTRVRLDRHTKTVQTGALWTEEYIPWGTLFMGNILDTGFVSHYCDNASKDRIEMLMELLGLKNSSIGHLIVGGKETVGGGLISFTILDSDTSKKGESS